MKNSSDDNNSESQKVTTQENDIDAQEVLEALADPEKDPEKLKQISYIVRQQSLHSGPLPPPEIFKGYEDVLPGAADRILSMAEKESRHRQDLEKISLKGDLSSRTLGQTLAFVISISAIGAGTYMVISGATISGTLLSGSGLASIVVAFLKNGDPSQKNNKNEPSLASEENSNPSKPQS